MKFILGTAQLGLQYGITNCNKVPTIIESLNIIDHCILNNITTFDTAQAYGTSETILGKKSANTIIITKLNLIKDYTDLSDTDLLNEIDVHITTSIYNLNKSKIDILLLHDVNHYNYKNGLIWNKLLEYKKNNTIEKLGISVYNLNDLIDIIDDTNIQHIQLPFNILNSEWLNPVFQEKISKRKDLTIHCRSILLQGLIVSDKKYWQKINNLSDTIINYYINELDKLVVLCDVNNKIELAISYVKAMKWIDGIVFGVDNIDQLKVNIDLFNNVKVMSDDNVKIIQTLFKNVPKQITDPRLW
jgi:aryl-alcohol dehydrogenase-like predicted oxidoreductase